MTSRKLLRAAAMTLSAMAALLVTARHARADRVEMQNGDRYNGRVLELSTNFVVIQNDVLGKVSLPRDRIATIAFSAEPATNSIHLTGRTNSPARPQARPAGNANPPAPGVPPSVRQINTNSSLVQEIEDQFLKDAGPEAKAKFHEMLGGLADGKLDVNDIRTQARDALAQIKSIQNDAGGEAGGMMDMYVTILEKFLKDSEPTALPATNAAAAPPRLNLVPRDGQ
jgi:hypothetical protein